MNLHSTFNNLYRVFQSNRLGNDFVGCDCCVNAADVSTLRGTPLHELTARDVDRYSQKALTTWGKVRHFKYFLPRLLELLVVDPEGFTSVEVVLGKLALAKWRDWHPAEVSAVNEALDLLWEATLERQDVSNLADDVLCGLSRLGRDIQPLLRKWLQKSDGPAAEHLASFINWHVPSLIEKGRMSAGYWGSIPDQQQQVIAWLRSPEVNQFLLSAPGLAANKRDEALWLLASLNSTAS